MDAGDAEDVEAVLATREAALAARERQAACEPRDPDLLAALAKERDALADDRDAAANARDAASLTRRQRAAGRDVAASARDRRSREAHDDADAGFPDRFMSARDVDASAGNRADALVDERRARENRQRSHEDRQRAADDRDAAVEDARGMRAAMASRNVIGQAQGLLMAKHGITADEAFELLIRASQSGNVKLRDVAARLVEQHEG